MIDAGAHNVEDQRADPGSMLTLVRELIALRRQLAPGFELLDAAPGVLAYRRGEHVVAINTTAANARDARRRELGEPLLALCRTSDRRSRLAPSAGGLEHG